MDRFFDANNPVMQFLSRIVDLAILNLMTIVCMIPIVTAGAAITAMNNVLIHLVRKDETYVWKMFIKSFRQNLKQGIGLGILFTAIFAVAGVELMMLHSIDAKSSTMFMIIITVISICVFGVGIYTFALLSRFENTVRGTLFNAVSLALGHIPRTIGMLAICAGWAAFLWFAHGITLLLLLYGLTIPGFLCAKIYDPIFEKMETNEESAAE
ncbi:MAG: YesL family protein [Clostridia bacterium]|nr:YesL family protein [Clostridia bacterium]